jgi:hypothetical protein
MQARPRPCCAVCGARGAVRQPLPLYHRFPAARGAPPERAIPRPCPPRPRRPLPALALSRRARPRAPLSGPQWRRRPAAAGGRLWGRHGPHVWSHLSHLHPHGQRPLLSPPLPPALPGAAPPSGGDRVRLPSPAACWPRCRPSFKGGAPAVIAATSLWPIPLPLPIPGPLPPNPGPHSAPAWRRHGCGQGCHLCQTLSPSRPRCAPGRAAAAARSLFDPLPRARCLLNIFAPFGAFPPPLAYPLPRDPPGQNRPPLPVVGAKEPAPAKDAPCPSAGRLGSAAQPARGAAPSSCGRGPPQGAAAAPAGPARWDARLWGPADAAVATRGRQPARARRAPTSCICSRGAAVRRPWRLPPP